MDLAQLSVKAKDDVYYDSYEKDDEHKKFFVMLLNEYEPLKKAVLSTNAVPCKKVFFLFF